VAGEAKLPAPKGASVGGKYTMNEAPAGWCTCQTMADATVAPVVRSDGALHRRRTATDADPCDVCQRRHSRQRWCCCRAGRHPHRHRKLRHHHLCLFKCTNPHWRCVAPGIACLRPHSAGMPPDGPPQSVSQCHLSVVQRRIVLSIHTLSESASGHTSADQAAVLDGKPGGGVLLGPGALGNRVEI
jgi:hypothetical protein